MSEIDAIQAHPYAERFPVLGEAELAELVESIKANGLRNPIVLDTKGRILDGRNRLRACQRAEIEPEFVTYDGDDLAEYVIDANSSRRHMSTGARAMATALVLLDDGRRVRGRWKRGTVTVNGESSTSAWIKAVNNAGVVIDHNPDQAIQVSTGEIALDAAYRRACANRNEAQAKAAEEARAAAEEADAREFITEHDPELAAQVGDLLESFVEALDLWNRRNREEAERIRMEKAAAERAATQRAEGLRELYSGILRAVQTVASYGGSDDLGKLWAEFDAEHVDPPQLQEVLTVETLGEAQRLIDWLTTWTKENR